MFFKLIVFLLALSLCHGFFLFPLFKLIPVVLYGEKYNSTSMDANREFIKQWMLLKSNENYVG